MISRFRHASRAILGARDFQEDACAFAFPDARALYFTTSGKVNGTGELLAVLADGMGGHVAGAEAARTACRTFIEAYTEGRDSSDRLKAALDRSNAAIGSAVAADPRLEGMGSTLLAVAFGEGGLTWVSVGDSPLYLFRDRHLYQLNQDHSLAPVLDQLAAEGELAAEEALLHPRRHYLRSALTGSGIELVDLHDSMFQLQPGDWILLASDGIETLEPGLIADLMAHYADADPDTLARALIETIQSMDNPAQDNTTVMAVKPCFHAAAIA
ncbi:MAG: SpoIIE family protein phosphatase [Hyphomicrobiaceae bacterium]